MNAEEIEKIIAEKMAFFEEDGCSTTIRFFLSNGEAADVWYFEELECYVWSHGKEGFEDYSSLTADMVGWLEQNGLTAVRTETV